MFFNALPLLAVMAVGRLLDRTDNIAAPWGPPAMLAGGLVAFVVGALIDHAVWGL